ncbi:hypothetical protein XH94_28450 [Bradyrhizobium zhanjiangense]|uniref:Uncharacterized protein n=1 Tax=Bradyrhizobium zhanjiangense TaxID=1325107 RepID=A0A4Q0SCW4_9BRAD|nr:hypothetical protein XH94_28450 [Bradyrhizobium zhanjiangense]
MFLKTYEIITFCAHLRDNLGRCNGNREDEPAWISFSRRLQGGPRGGAGRNAIVDNDCRPTGNLKTLTISQIALTPPLYLGNLLAALGLEIGFADASEPNDIIIAHHDRCATIYDGTHCQLVLERDADLANDDEIERRMQRGCDLSCHGHATPRERQNGWVLVPVRGEGRRQLSTRFYSISERHVAILPSNLLLEP